MQWASALAACQSAYTSGMTRQQWTDRRSVESSYVERFMLKLVPFSTRAPGPMLNYVWRCFACDAANEPKIASCRSCGCPAAATVHVLQRFRTEFVARGGLVPASATRLHEPPELSALEVLSPLLAVATFGFWPPLWPTAKSATTRSK